MSLVGERNSSLEHVTYGTLINVIPRFSSQGQIEMSLTIEDGTGNSQSNYNYNNEIHLSFQKLEGPKSVQ